MPLQLDFSQLLAVGLGPWEIGLIFMVVLLLFGAKKVPELARGFGKSVREFRKAATEVQDDLQAAIDATDPKNEPQPHARAPQQHSQPQNAQSTGNDSDREHAEGQRVAS